MSEVSSERAAQLERAVALLRVRELPAERLERWVLVAGAVLVPVGVVVILAGWWGAARSPFVFDQVPYLLSGGFLGLALATAGGLLYFGYWLTRLVREGREQAEEQRELLTEIPRPLGRGTAQVTVEIELPGEDDRRRQEVRRWLEEHPKPSPMELARAGYVVPHWPAPSGRDADPELQLMIDEELRRAGVRRPINPIGTGHCGPVLVVHGNDQQRERYLWPMLSGEELWCQLFSEPDAGSDLASLATRAERDGEVYVVNGQKIWTSVAEFARYGILLARTRPDLPKHRGISYFIVPMDLPGIEIRPIRNMTGGGSSFNEVFFSDVRVPAENLIGDENNGWAMAKETLANERVSLSVGGVQWGFGPTAADLVESVRQGGGARDHTLRARVVDVFIEGEILRYHRLRQVSAAVHKRPGPDASLRKALNDPHGQRVCNLAKDLMGPCGMLGDGMLPGPLGDWWAQGFLFSPALTVGGGTSEVLRNVMAERLLGLPHEVDVT